MPAYKGELINLYADSAKSNRLKASAQSLPSWDLSLRQQSVIELLMSGALSPLRGFMGQADYQAVLDKGQLADSSLWPLPITLDVSEKCAEGLSAGSQLVLRDLEGVVIAILTVDEIWRPELGVEARAIYGADSSSHPGMAALLDYSHPVYLSGAIQGLETPAHHSFKRLRYSPRELRQQFSKLTWGNVIAMHSTRPIHRAEYKMVMQAALDNDANVMLHPLVAEGEQYHSRVRCYQEVLKYFPEQTTLLALLPLAERHAGLREQILHAIIRQNYGCTHMIVWDQYATFDTQSTIDAALAEAVVAELDIKLVRYELPVYVEARGEYVSPAKLQAGDVAVTLDSDEFYRRLDRDLEVPEWFSFPEVVDEVRSSYPPLARRGLTLFFTGLSGSGKSTIANAVLAKLLEIGGRHVTLLDGDVVRTHLSSELGFSKEHRNINIRRIGYVASEITKNGGIAICAPIAPYKSLRREVCDMVSEYGTFVEIHVATSLEVCEARDRKGLYALARAGKIKEFTGISDPYEEPESPEIRIDTNGISIEEAAQQVFHYLRKERLTA
ncbi:MAG: adenylyl-sulfate kinase [Gammaproteobacteria bacterium]|nr:MAG: adenylyl-sulfate kinase [Gammaproteobacteria bacterium]